MMRLVRFEMRVQSRLKMLLTMEIKYRTYHAGNRAMEMTVTVMAFCRGICDGRRGGGLVGLDVSGCRLDCALPGGPTAPAMTTVRKGWCAWK